jgi:hypothetical protein
MKQITLKQAEALALADEYRLRYETQYCQEDWIKANARYIADIEMKRCDKTAYGQFPKGWKAEMKRAATEKSRADILARFLRDECKQLNGAIWLGNWQMIQEMERGPA